MYLLQEFWLAFAKKWLGGLHYFGSSCGHGFLLRLFSGGLEGFAIPMDGSFRPWRVVLLGMNPWI